MQVLELDWPFAIRTVVTSAQRLADERGHASTSAAHVSAVLYEMKPVRTLVATGLTPTAVETALLVEKKATTTRAMLTSQLHQVLTGPAARTTLDFLRAYSTGHATAHRVGLVVATHAEAIAALLDHPGLEPILKAPTSELVKSSVPEITMGCLRAGQAKHGQLTTRHVVLGALALVDRALQERGLPGLEGDLAQLADLIDRTVRKEGALVVSPRLVGAVAEALAGSDERALHLRVLTACLEDDEAVAFASRAMEQARERYQAHETAP